MQKFEDSYAEWMYSHLFLMPKIQARLISETYLELLKKSKKFKFIKNVGYRKEYRKCKQSSRKNAEIVNYLIYVGKTDESISSDRAKRKKHKEQSKTFKLVPKNFKHTANKPIIKISSLANQKI